MRFAPIFICCFVFNSTTLFSITFEEAFCKHLIQIINLSPSGNDEKDFRIQLKNCSASSLNIFIPIGTIFVPQDSSYQPRFLSENSLLFLARNEIGSLEISSVCGQASRSTPFTKTTYKYEPSKNYKLGELKNFLKMHPGIFSKSDIQNAVWCISNQHRIESIGDVLLRNALSKITGQIIQPLKFTYKHENIPGQVAYDDKELRIEGLFRYGTPEDITASLGLYNEQGQLVKMLRDKMVHKRGQHSFRFDFTIVNVKKGTYFVRLMTNEMVLNELKISA